MGAVTSAGTVAATIFCCLPFATGILGAGVAAFGARFAPFQPYLIAASLACLGFSFYQAYRSDPACAEGCDVSTMRRRRLFVWVLACAVVLLLSSSWWADRVIYWTL